MKRLLLLLVSFATAASFAEGFDIRGTVQDDQGKPLAGAKVWLIRECEPRAAETDTAGQFMFPGSAAGFTHLLVWKEGYALGGHSGVVLGAETFTFTLAAPEELALRVIDYAYRPVEGARIASMIVNRDIVVPVDDLVNTGFPSARSDKDGHLAFTGLPARAMVEVRAAHRDFVETHLQPVPVGQQVLTVQLRSGKTLRGRVVNETGAGVGNALVSVLDVGRGPLGECIETRSDPEGYFRVEVLPGQYDAGARHPDFSPAMPQRVDVANTTANVANTTANVANTTANVANMMANVSVDLSLLPPRFISGRIVDPSGAPAPGVWLACFLDVGLYDETVTALDGSFRLKACPGESTLRVSPPDGVLVREGDALPVKLEGNEAAFPDIHLDRLPEITGTILGPEDAPAPNVLISSLNLDPPLWLLTDPKGGFRIELVRAPAGPARFRAEHPLRFLRTDFEADIRAPAGIKAALTAFDPNLAPGATEGRWKDLAELAGKPAPELECGAWFNVPDDSQAGNPSLTLASLRGKVVVLTFWNGTDDSAPAHYAIEELRALYDLFRFSDASDVAIVAVHDNAASPEAVRQYAQHRRIEFPVGRDLDSTPTFQQYKVRMTPQTVLIDRSGVLRHYDVGGRLLELIKDLRRGS